MRQQSLHYFVVCCGLGFLICRLWIRGALLIIYSEYWRWRLGKELFLSKWLATHHYRKLFFYGQWNRFRIPMCFPFMLRRIKERAKWSRGRKIQSGLCIFVGQDFDKLEIMWSVEVVVKRIKEGDDHSVRCRGSVVFIEILISQWFYVTGKALRSAKQANEEEEHNINNNGSKRRSCCRCCAGATPRHATTLFVEKMGQAHTTSTTPP